MKPMLRPFALVRPLVVILLLAPLVAVPRSARAEAVKPPAPAPTARRAPVAPGLPAYQEPAAYSVDMTFHAPKADMVMKRFVDHGRIRTEMSGTGHDVVMIETGDEKGTMLTLMPSEKRAMKQSRATMEAMVPKGKPAAKAASAEATPAPEVNVEDLGDDTLDGRAVHKLRMTTPEGTALGWFDKASGAPVRMEGTAKGETTVIEWKNYKVGDQPAKLFEAPKDYEVTDMDEMMEQMKGMKGMGGMGVGAMMGGMAQGMGQGMGQSMGAGLGASLGGAMGGPLGAMAGQYLGGRVGGMVGRKAAAAVTPGK